jgi:hypothetical protein
VLAQAGTAARALDPLPVRRRRHRVLVRRRPVRDHRHSGLRVARLLLRGQRVVTGALLWDPAVAAPTQPDLVTGVKGFVLTGL